MDFKRICESMELVAFRERENVVRYRHVGHAIRRRSFAYYVDFQDQGGKTEHFQYRQKRKKGGKT